MPSPPPTSAPSVFCASTAAATGRSASAYSATAPATRKRQAAHCANAPRAAAARNRMTYGWKNASASFPSDARDCRSRCVCCLCCLCCLCVSHERVRVHLEGDAIRGRTTDRQSTGASWRSQTKKARREKSRLTRGASNALAVAAARLGGADRRKGTHFSSTSSPVVLLRVRGAVAGAPAESRERRREARGHIAKPTHSATGFRCRSRLLPVPRSPGPGVLGRDAHRNPTRVTLPPRTVPTASLPSRLPPAW
jgi:hypothetical protein